jgi:hypothetical protein
MWDVSNVQDMSNMFQGASSFDQNLCDWRTMVDTKEVPTISMFDETNCDIILPFSNGWCQSCL